MFWLIFWGLFVLWLLGLGIVGWWRTQRDRAALEATRIYPFAVNHNDSLGLTSESLIDEKGWYALNPAVSVHVSFTIRGISTEEVLGANYIVSESPATLALVFKDIVSGWSKIYTRHDDQRNAQNASEALERLLPWLLGEYCPNFQGRVKRVWAYVRFQSQK